MEQTFSFFTHGVAIYVSSSFHSRSHVQTSRTSLETSRDSLALPAQAAAPHTPTLPEGTWARSRNPAPLPTQPAHADSAAAARPPQPLPPRRSAAVWSPLTAPRPADAASSCASTLPYQKRGGASAFTANQRQPRPRRAGPPCGQEEADWMTAAPGRGVRGPRPPLFSAAGRQPRPRPDR